MTKIDEEARMPRHLTDAVECAENGRGFATLGRRGRSQECEFVYPFARRHALLAVTEP